jgi:hypothetical protein
MSDEEEGFDVVPTYLLIRGVYLNDCKSIDDLLEEHLLGAETIELEDVYVYDKLPLTYTGLSTWPMSTNLVCWHCARQFSGIPLFVPKSIEPIGDGKFAMSREGCFSSWACAAAYIDLQYPRVVDNANRKNMLKFLYRNMIGRPIADIPSAPPIFHTERYGGDMTDAEFDQITTTLSAPRKA